MLFKLSVRNSENPLLLLAPTIMDSLRVAAMDEIYFSVAIALSNSENPRTETEFQDLLVQKVYTFFFCNAFFSLFYISFIKKHIEGCTPSGEEVRGAGGVLSSSRLTPPTPLTSSTKWAPRSPPTRTACTNCSRRWRRSLSYVKGAWPLLLLDYHDYRDYYH